MLHSNVSERLTDWDVREAADVTMDNPSVPHMVGKKLRTYPMEGGRWRTTRLLTRPLLERRGWNKKLIEELLNPIDDIVMWTTPTRYKYMYSVEDVTEGERSHQFVHEKNKAKRKGIAAKFWRERKHRQTLQRLRKEFGYSYSQVVHHLQDNLGPCTALPCDPYQWIEENSERIIGCLQMSISGFAILRLINNRYRVYHKDGIAKTIHAKEDRDAKGEAFAMLIRYQTTLNIPPSK